DAGEPVVCGGGGEVHYGIQGWLGSAYLSIGQPERWVEMCRAQLRRGRDTRGITRAYLVFALMVAGCGEEARTAATGLIASAEATRNPYAISFALSAYGFAYTDADPGRAREALRRGLVIAQDSGNLWNESSLVSSLYRIEARYGDPRAALDYLTVSIRNYHNSGNTAMFRGALALLATFVDR